MKSTTGAAQMAGLSHAYVSRRMDILSHLLQATPRPLEKRAKQKRKYGMRCFLLPNNLLFAKGEICHEEKVYNEDKC